MKGGDNIKNKNLIIIINVLKDASGVLYQKDLIRILASDINERQVRRELKKLEDLGYVKIYKEDNRRNVLYLTSKGYLEILNKRKRVSSNCNNYILGNNFIDSYIKYKYKNILDDNIWYQVYEESEVYVQISKEIELLRKFRDGIIMYNMYIYENREIVKDEYTTILNLIVYKHYIQNKDIKNLIIILNKLIERCIDLEYNTMIDYKIYSLNSVNMISLEKSLENHYSKKENISEISKKYKIECVDLRKNDYD